ncbi:CHAT domain-containing protein [Streptomyces sp. NPDC015032]|uniref:CHAT domain-containing protein n=1 Tax=Streptomyces sp. NPDC015032 TaxID=3364937 RepID=UPI0036FD3D02
MMLLDDHEEAPLSVETLLQADLTGARLAFLSACATAAPSQDVRLRDETIHLTTAFQLAGFRQVVGTLWPINDMLAAEIADVFYSHLRSDPRRKPDPDRAAVTLHQTIQTIHDRYPELPSVWAAYVHAGV